MSDTMTRKEALEELLGKAEAGENWTAGTFEDLGLAAAFDLPDAASLIHAYRGSLDAALALHEAVLPGWIWRVNHIIDGWDAILELPMNIKVQTAVSFDNPARAWLIAIIKALIEEETG